MDPIANGPLNGSFNGPLPANIVQLRKHFERLHATGGDAAVRPTLTPRNFIRSGSQASTSSSPVPPPAPTPAPLSEKHSDPATRQYFDHSMGTRINTDALITRSLSDEYPNLSVTVVPASMLTGDAFDLLSFAVQGNASVIPLEDNSSLPDSLEWTFYVPPFRRLNGSVGFIAEQMLYGRFLYKWEGHEFIIYFVDGRDGTDPWGASRNWYILTPQRHNADALVRTVSAWCSEVRNEILVYDGGWWQRSAVPWKRGIIYHGPPGNGKTITIKATMRMLQSLDPYVPTLYVRSLDSWSGPSAAISQIFNKAREFAPCYLVLEDIDTIITDDVRSYFLNEVDGLKSNDGIFIIASTNHLDRLDPGIAKRPSRFDRKYLFPDPNVDQREAYCRFWQAKLKSNKDIEFPDRLCRAIAEITDKFSFAYIQEAFVAALLALARRGSGAGERRTSGASADAWIVVSDDAGDGLDKLVLWVEIQKQIEILREGINDGNGGEQ
ncbi:putative ATPase YjoB like protein [Verticillium longisporum]|uniref:Putative ATPase YjoB like protein n=1 Tax=Verticillium longisporum TaxID=100787 RepID=A0A8I2ZT84_VERLO|nr:putative ATPase YjoB like protein [Verticillium longisporum]